METFADQANLIVELNAERNVNYDNLNDYQRNHLTALYIKSMKHKEEALEDLMVNPEFYAKIFDTLVEQHFADHNILLKELGELVVNHIKQYCKKYIEKEINKDLSQLAIKRQFYNQDGEYDHSKNLDPMKHPLYNHPDL